MENSIINKHKKFIYVILSVCLAFFMSTINIFAARKIITKNVSDSLTVWSAYHYNYSFSASAVLTFDSSNKITQISDLSFSNIKYTTGSISLAASFTPTQKSKATYNGGQYAKYVVTVQRNVYGYYTDRIDYTLTYRPTDAGSPYSMDGGTEPLVLVDVEVGDPYDIQVLK